MTTTSTDQAPLLSVRGLKRYFPLSTPFFSPARFVRAVDGIDLDIRPGETLGLVGESGCGKSTVGRLIARLDTATAGTIDFDNVRVSDLDNSGLKTLRQSVQMIFQNPFSSLNPRMTVGAILEEPLIIHRKGDSAARRRRVLDLMDQVGLRRDQIDRYPHEFSGGQRQRIGIARALALNPRLIICDEPVSALDVSIQAQIINLLIELQKDLGLSYLFISHDLSVVEHISDRVAVMYLGRIVEQANAPAIYAEPLHPYTEALLSAVPPPDPLAVTHEILLEGGVPSPSNPPPGCHFAPRCPYAMPKCSQSVPELEAHAPGRLVRCMRLEEIAGHRLGATNPPAVPSV